METINLQGSTLTEAWVQQEIANGPTILGLGDLDVRDIERRQPSAGRLDLLLFDPESNTRYVVELQLGPTDASHIIRTVEYWDIERRRYPQYEHMATIIAEKITGRFFNVINLFNRSIPIIAIKITSLRISEEEVSLVFTKILDHSAVEIDCEEDRIDSTDRTYWEKGSSLESMRVVDEVYTLIAKWRLSGILPHANESDY